MTARSRISNSSLVVRVSTVRCSHHAAAPNFRKSGSGSQRATRVSVSSTGSPRSADLSVWLYHICLGRHHFPNELGDSESPMQCARASKHCLRNWVRGETNIEAKYGPTHGALSTTPAIHRPQLLAGTTTARVRDPRETTGKGLTFKFPPPSSLAERDGMHPQAQCTPVCDQWEAPTTLLCKKPAQLRNCPSMLSAVANCTEKESADRGSDALTTRRLRC